MDWNWSLVQAEQTTQCYFQCWDITNCCVLARTSRYQLIRGANVIILKQMQIIGSWLTNEMDRRVGADLQFVGIKASGKCSYFMSLITKQPWSLLSSFCSSELSVSFPHKRKAFDYSCCRSHQLIFKNDDQFCLTSVSGIWVKPGINRPNELCWPDTESSWMASLEVTSLNENPLTSASNQA